MSARRLVSMSAAMLLAAGATACGPQPEHGTPNPPRVTSTLATSTSTHGTGRGPDGDTGSSAEGSSGAAATMETPPEKSGAAVTAPDSKAFPLMHQRSERGALAAYEFFWQHYAYASQTGDTGTFRSLAAPSCGWCAEAASGIEAQEDVWQHGSVRFLRTMVKNHHGNRIQVLARIEASVSMFEGKRSAGDVVDASGEYVVGSNMEWQGRAWVVTSVDTVKDE